MRSCIKQKFDKKIRQQEQDFVSWLTDKRLKEREGTQRTLERVKVTEREMEPLWVTIVVSPLGSSTTQLIVVNSVSKWTECAMWLVAPVLITQVSPLKAVLFATWVEKIECLKSIFLKGDIPAIVKASAGLEALIEVVD